MQPIRVPYTFVSACPSGCNGREAYCPVGKQLLAVVHRLRDCLPSDGKYYTASEKAFYRQYAEATDAYIAHVQPRES